MRARSATAMLLALLALSACSGSEGFKNEDPEAHSACTKFLVEPSMEGISSDDEIVVVLGTVLIVGEHAAKSTTPDIQETAEKLSGMDQWLLDDDALIAACTDAGYELNEHSVAAHYLAQ